MVDCSGCEWKQEMNSISCKKNNDDIGWINCDYRCTPFGGDNFKDNYFGEGFKTEFFCDGPTDEDSYRQKNILLKNSYNTNDNICVFSEDDNKCLVSNNINLNDLISDSNLYSKTNDFIYNENIINDDITLKKINETNFRSTSNNSSIVSSCTIEKFYDINDCDGKNINVCEENEGCVYNFVTETCINKDLLLPQIDFNRYYNSFYSDNIDDNSIFNIVYQRYQKLREISNWPCITSDIDYPINCSNDSQFQKMFIKSQYLDSNEDGSDAYKNINLSPNQLLYDQNLFIELINDRCFTNTGEMNCKEFTEEAKFDNIERYAKIIRDHTISIFTNLSSYTFDRLPYILFLEFQLFLENQDNINQEEEQSANVKDINNLQLYPEKADFLIDNLKDNDKFRGCFNDVLYVENEEELFNFILYNSLIN